MGKRENQEFDAAALFLDESRGDVVGRGCQRGGGHGVETRRGRIDRIYGRGGNLSYASARADFRCRGEVEGRGVLGRFWRPRRCKSLVVSFVGRPCCLG